MKNFNEYFLNEKKDDNNEIIHSALIDFIKNTKSDWNYITPEQLNDEKLSNYFLVDIRKEKDFKEGHIKGAINIFWMDLLKDENIKKFPKDEKIILICYVGHTASQMMFALKLLGYDVLALKFGMGKSPVEGVPVAGWLDFGFKVVK